jgi:hypothetical protein
MEESENRATAFVRQKMARRTREEWEAGAALRAEEALNREQAETENAAALRYSLQILEGLNLSVLHLRRGRGMYDVLAASKDDRQVNVALAWLGDDCTVLSVDWDDGRLFTIARVNAEAGDRFSRKEGWRVGLPRLHKECIRLEEQGVNFYRRDHITGKFMTPRRWGDFYWMSERPRRETIVYASMLAASQILLSHAERMVRKS